MKIAICDDNSQDLAQLKHLLAQCAPQILVDSFSTALALYESAKATKYDACILDIEMESPNGYEIALELAREEAHPVILFLTNSAAYAVRGYGLALRYLLKPLSTEALAEALDAVQREIQGNRLMLELDGGVYVWNIHDIRYAEVHNHHTTVYTTTGSHSFRAPLKELQNQLPARWFSMPHQSYLVGLLHVRSVTPLDVVLTDGTKIPVSRRRQQEFVHSFHRFLGV